ncbi:NAD(P)/FAD-dependent oxidoreductase [Peribacillus sp. B-H-3]|jgi:D-amino-acid dehydrogenase|uniref:NAD(P)/FAD-dependent oxidoreductase n=1 Tax=Peribacillus sp. B-H-3 TaxID=3400420 RepID=UPI003B01F3AE
MQRYIVIGAGILGASTAYQLAKSGAEVVIADRKDRGQATDAAAGIVCPWLSQRRNKAWYRLAKEGARFYPDLIESLKQDGETDTGYAQVGAISLHSDSEKLIAMKERALKRKEDAPEMGDITILNPEQTKSLFPPLAEGIGSVHVSGASRVDGRALRDSLLRAAEKNGAVFIEGAASLNFKDKQVIGANVNGEVLEGMVIVCAGAWATQLLKPLGVNFQVTFQKAQIVHLKLPGTSTKTWPVVMPPSDQYLLAFEDRLVAGATHENTEEYDSRVTAGGLQEVLNKALLSAPGLEKASFLEARTGFRPFTPGFLPVIGSLPGWEGILAANGLGASGLTMGPYIGYQLSKLALGLETDIDLEQYDLNSALEA